MLFGRWKIIRRSGSKGRNGEREEGPRAMTRKAVVFFLGGAGIMELEIGKVRRRMTGDSVADLSGR
jgi:hypothetical protein